MSRCFGYIRVSKDPEKDKLSPDVQRQLIRRYAGKERLELLEIFGDVDIPSRKIDFAGTWGLMVDQLQPGDLVITNDASRLGRNIYETLTRVRDVDSKHCEIVSLEGNIDRDRAAGAYMFHILLATAQFINDQLSEKLREVHTFKAERGEWKGGGITPLGYSYTPGAKKLEVLDAEAEVVQEIFLLRDAGWGYEAIAREMDRRGIRGKKGRMNYSSIRQILHNATYVGKRVHRGKVHEGLQEAIVEQDVFDRVQARNGLATTQARPAKHLLSGMVECGDCGGPMIYWTGSRHNGKARCLLYCKEAKVFREKRWVSIESHLLEAWTTERFLGRLDEKRIEAAAGRARKRGPKRENKVESLKKELARVEASIARLQADRYDFAEPLIDAEQFRVKHTELTARRACVLEGIGELEAEARLDNVVYLERAYTFADRWEAMTLDERREGMRLFIAKVEVHPRDPAKGKVQPDRVKMVWK